MGNKVFIISGKQGGGKTTFLQKVLNGLRDQNIRAGGIVAEGYWKNNVRDRFELIDLKTNRRIDFCQRESNPGWEKVRHFYINPFGQSFGEKALHPDNLSEMDIVVIDEVGPFEVEGKGWATAIEDLLNNSELPMIWVVRESIVFEVLEKWGTEAVELFHIDEIKSLFAAEEILNSLKVI